MATRLGPEDLHEFNHWLWVTRVRALVLVALILLIHQIVSPGPLADVHLVMGVVAVDLGACLAYYRWWQSRRRPRLLAYVQLAADTLAIGVGLALLTHPLPPLFHFLLIMPLIPASLIERQCGVVIAFLGSLCHLAALANHGQSIVFSSDVILVPVGLFLIAQQSAFYSEYLARKNAALAQAAVSLNASKDRFEEEAAASSALVQTAHALTTSLDPHEILHRFNEVLRESLSVDFVVTLLYDPNRDSFRLAAGAGAHAEVLETVRAHEFRRIDFPLLNVLAEREFAAIESRDTDFIAADLMRQWDVSSFLAVELRRAGHSVGLLIAGFNQRQGPFPARAIRLLRSAAQQAAVALENARLVESLRAASRLKSEFIGTMSHELRSPLNVVIGYSDLLIEGDLGPINAAQSDALLKVQGNALQLLELIQETLDVNRLEAGLLPLDFETFSVADFISELGSSLPATWAKHGVNLVWCPPERSLVLHSDRGKLRKVLRNLIHNAIKFTESGIVTVSANGCDEWVEFVVEDTGIGMSEDVVPIIFEMFRQGDGSTTRRHGGVGLGLYIVKQLVRGLGGDVQVRTTPGQGSAFAVRLGRGPNMSVARAS